MSDIAPRHAGRLFGLCNVRLGGTVVSLCNCNCIWQPHTAWCPALLKGLSCPRTHGKAPRAVAQRAPAPSYLMLPPPAPVPAFPLQTFGSLAGIVGVSAAGFIVERTGSFASVFHITAGLYVLGTLVWNLFCTAERQFD